MSLNKSYDPQTVESHWYQTWEQNGYFSPAGSGEPYCIVLPPPNVTGRLHMGHAFQDTLMDALIRYQRMRGHRTLWQGGTDHAGIATQMVVERQLAAEHTNRREVGREAFVERAFRFKAESGGHIQRQLRRLGASIDWSGERFTMDEAYSDAVTEHFVRLYEDGLVYRGKRLVNWDPVLLTALSDLEVDNVEEQGHLWHIRYPLEDSSGELIVATTRPETLLGDVALAVHPDDARYAQYLGKQVALPLTDRTIPVIADAYVDPEFGTGCLKITPAHDFNDFEVGERHGLAPVNIFTPEAALNAEVPEAYRGLDRFEARRRIVADLEAQGLLARIEKHRLTVPRGDRSGAVLEPFLTDQWFVKTQPLAERAIEAVTTGRIRFVPENWRKTYFQWLENIQDWCISRQLWWGHRIPAWYDDQGRVYVGRCEAEVRANANLSSSTVLTRDDDVFDTWFSSALWPFAALGWPKKTERLEHFYPSDVLVTGFDIIFFWVARMAMAGLHFMDEVPFREVYVHGLIRDSQGQKMSKSKGNVLDPIDLIDGIALDELVAKRTEGMMQPRQREQIEKATRKEFPEGIPAFGADALRFTFAALATTGRDIRFDLGRIDGYRNFCNKLWNAARFVLMNCEDHDPYTARGQTTIAERWIRARLDVAAGQVHRHMADYRFDLIAQSLYEFTWNEYCDWYLELAKHDLQSAASDADKACVRQSLLEVLEALLRLLHPFMPFITEELWQQVKTLAGVEGESIMLAAQPETDTAVQDTRSLEDMGWVQSVITAVRRLRSELDVAPSKRITLTLQGGDQRDRKRADVYAGYIQSLARVETIDWADKDADLNDCAATLSGELKLAVPLAGLIDVDAEIARLNKDIARQEQQAQRSRAKLANQNFINNAPQAVVDTERERLAEHESALAKLTQQIQKFKDLV